MSITTTASRENEYADRWRRWQLRNEESSRRGAMRARIVFTVILTVVAAWLGRSCLSSGGKVRRVVIRRPDVTYAAFFTCSIS